MTYTYCLFTVALGLLLIGLLFAGEFPLVEIFDFTVEAAISSLHRTKSNLGRYRLRLR